MRTLIIVLACLAIVSLAISGWTLSQLQIVKKDLEAQKTKVTKLAEGIKSGKLAKRKAEPPKNVVVSIDDDPILGNPKAPVTIIEFSDYQCPYCRKFHTQVLPKIKEEYVDKGKVRYIFRDFPLNFHKKAIPAAVAANCAGDQGKYWVMNDFLFENPNKLDHDSILESAKDLDLDYNKFKSCIDTNDHEKEINQDFEDGKKYGVRGTPSLFIGKSTDGNKEFTGKYFRGLRPFETYKQEIDTLLAN